MRPLAKALARVATAKPRRVPPPFDEVCAHPCRLAGAWNGGSSLGCPLCFLHLQKQGLRPPAPAEDGVAGNPAFAQPDHMCLVAHVRYSPLFPVERELNQLTIVNGVASDVSEMSRVGVPPAELFANGSGSLNSEPPVRNGGVQDSVLPENALRESSALDAGQQKAYGVCIHEIPILSRSTLHIRELLGHLAPAHTKDINAPDMTAVPGIAP